MTVTEKLELAASLCYTEISKSAFNCNQKGWGSFEVSSQTMLANQLKLYYEIVSDDTEFADAPKIEKTESGYLFKGVNFIIT